MKRRPAYVEMEDVDMGDWPDFCDAWISYAEWEDGTSLSQDELDELNRDDSYVYEKALDSLK